MGNSKLLYMSYILDADTPSYGGRNKFKCEKISSISNGDAVNDSFISTTVHIGTHIDLPYHFYDDGQTIEAFSIEFYSGPHK
jgi:arylformamidase